MRNSIRLIRSTVEGHIVLNIYKGVTILKIQMYEIKSSLLDLDSKVDRKFDEVNKKIDTKFDRLMLLIIGGVVLKGGFELYRGKKGV